LLLKAIANSIRKYFLKSVKKVSNKLYKEINEELEAKIDLPYKVDLYYVS